MSAVMNLGYSNFSLLLVFLAGITPLGGVLHAQASAVSERTPSPESDKSKPQLQTGGKGLGSLPAATSSLADKAANAFSRRDWATARACYREMLGADPENALAWANLGAVEQQDGKLEQAVLAFEASVRFNARLVQSWLALGALLSQQGDRYRAISCFTRALHEDPLDPRAHNFLAIEAKNMGWRDAAIQELQRTIELKPDYGLAHFNLATLYLDQKPPATLLAKRHYEQALALGEKKDEVLERRLQEE